MGRRNDNARYIVRGHYTGQRTFDPAEAMYGPAGARTILPESFTSARAVEKATALVDRQHRVTQEVGDFAKAAISLWGELDAPHTAADFWRRNATLESTHSAHVPEYFRGNLGVVLGWAVVENQKPTVLGGSQDAIGVFAPVRMKAGQVAQAALLNACNNDKAALAGMSQPIPVYVTAVDLSRDWDRVRIPLEFRLPEYPPQGETVNVRMGLQELSVGDNPAPQPRQYSDLC